MRLQGAEPITKVSGFHQGLVQKASRTFKKWPPEVARHRYSNYIRDRSDPRFSYQEGIASRLAMPMMRRYL